MFKQYSRWGLTRVQYALDFVDSFAVFTVHVSFQDVNHAICLLYGPVDMGIPAQVVGDVDASKDFLTWSKILVCGPLVCRYEHYWPSGSCAGQNIAQALWVELHTPMLFP